ncbi:hypothetical protein JNW91_04265 [Micromonospora sp. STR1_7]|uniref:Uncharacterized protein n=1 Tax=Micromonospora parastrephiae TaxID=2806101 RepID=A0ABS1XPH2_9ACTN|nr:hypothetical protein [Micromonospora parastrephiae]MBM0231160.1 hypothetical protein [Micromonospora parastrephiae]
MLGFRSVFTTHRERNHLQPLVREQLDRWIAGPKGWDPSALQENRWATIGDNVRALLLQHEGQDGSTSTRVRIAETKPDGQWIIQLTVHTPNARERAAWAWIDIESPDPDSEDPRGRPRLAGTPRFLAPMLEIIDAWDGAARLTTRPIVIRGDEVDEVHRALTDAERRGVVFVAGNDDSLPSVPWTNRIANLTRFTIGMASCYVLDGEATQLLNDRLGQAHAVVPGRLRTFRSQVQPDSVVDGLRHRVLSAERITDDSEQPRLARVLASNAQLQALEQPLPATVARVHRMLERIADDMLVHRLGDVGSKRRSLVPSQPRATAVETRESDRPQDDVNAQQGMLLDYLKIKVGIDDLTVDRIDEIVRLIEVGRSSQEAQEDIASRLAQLQAELDETQKAYHDVKWQLDDEQIENRDAVDLLTRSEETVRTLRHRLASMGQAEVAWTAQPADEDVSRPGSFGELLRWLPKLKHVVFTGDPDHAEDLDSNDPLGAWASKTWDALLVLRDYAVAKANGRWGRDVHGFLEHTPDGCHEWPTRRHARDESEEVRTNPTFRSRRVLPVPTSVVPVGQAFMGAHFKIVQFAMISPRMHYYDDTARSGRVYVGYIGRHLPTGQTN